MQLLELSCTVCGGHESDVACAATPCETFSRKETSTVFFIWNVTLFKKRESKVEVIFSASYFIQGRTLKKKKKFSDGPLARHFIHPTKMFSILYLPSLSMYLLCLYCTHVKRLNTKNESTVPITISHVPSMFGMRAASMWSSRIDGLKWMTPLKLHTQALL